MNIMLTVLLGAFGSILAAELLGLCPALTRFLLTRAVDRLPSAHRDRYRDEWLGDLDHIKRSRGDGAVLLWAVCVYCSSYSLMAAIESTPAADDSSLPPADTRALAGIPIPPFVSDPRRASLEFLEEYWDALIQLPAWPASFQAASKLLLDVATGTENGTLIADTKIFIAKSESHLPDDTLVRLVVYFTKDHLRNVITVLFVDDYDDDHDHPRYRWRPPVAH